MKPIIMLFYGVSGAGKTTLAQDFCRQYGNASKHVELDHYYNTITSFEGVNVYRPELLNWDLLRSDLQALKAGETITMPKYEMANATSYKAQGETIVPKEVIVCTSMYGFDDTELQRVWDLKFYITPCSENQPLDVFDATLERRIKRDIEVRKRTGDWVREQTEVMRSTAVQLNYQNRARAAADGILVNQDNKTPDLSPVKEMVCHLWRQRIILAVNDAPHPICESDEDIIKRGVIP